MESELICGLCGQPLQCGRHTMPRHHCNLEVPPHDFVKKDELLPEPLWREYASDYLSRIGRVFEQKRLVDSGDEEEKDDVESR